ncbi:MAG: hypothetical protein REI09_00510 [Candidatus Dactylopiibacterium sp.]|nr:hypothetical protein [Candidatus Dactylopiibacterium sp.]
MTTSLRRKTPALVLACAAVIGLTACGGGDSIEDAIDDLTKGVFLDNYVGSCGGGAKTIDVNVAQGGSVGMGIRVRTTGDVEPLSGEWFTEGSDWQHVLGTSSPPDLRGTVDGRFFNLNVKVVNTGNMEFRLVVKDKNGDKRFEDRCKVHVNITG